MSRHICRLVAMAAVMAAVVMPAQGEPSGMITPEGVRKELDAITPAALLDKTWGLVCPETSVRVAEVKDVSAERHADWTILPDGARFEAGALVFTLGAKPAVVGVWNCRNLLPLDRRVNLGVRFDLEVEFEQSAPDTTAWTLVPWFVGRRSNWGGTIARLKAAARPQIGGFEKTMQDSVYRYSRRTAAGAGRHVIRIEDAGPRDGRIGYQAPADGVELEIKGPAGGVIKIHRITILHKRREGGFRREFELPAGPVWRAVASVNRKTLLFINGREVPSSSIVHARPSAAAQDLQEVDLKPYLKPGKNVAAVRPAFDTDANALVQIAVVMASGEVLELNTDPGWRYVPKCEPGWDRPEFSGAAKSITKKGHGDSQFMPSDVAAIRYGWRPTQLGSFILPAYGGRVLLHSPDDHQLYFCQEKPFQLRARVPAGLAASKPVIQWLVCRCREDGTLEAALSGVATTFSTQGDSLEFELAGAALPMGVYMFKAVLRGADGQVIEDRMPEPCVVTGRIPMTPASGESLAHGLDLEPEAILDLTRPNDPAFPWMEMSGANLWSEPLIVTRNGLTYRETRSSGARALITYNYAFKHPGDFYLMELDYPDDQPRFFGVNLCSEHDGRGDHSKAGPSVWTGIRHLNTGTMQTLAWLFRPDHGYTSISLINMLPNSAAAASTLRIRHVRGHLPELRTGGSQRGFGILMEHSSGHCGFGKTFRCKAAPKAEAEKQRPFVVSNRPLRARLDALVEWLDTCNHYAEYQRWAGQNLICLSFFQYTGTRPDAVPISVTGDQRVVPDINDVAARVFRANGIEFMTSIGYCSDPILQAKCRTSAADLTDSLLLINGEGAPARAAPLTGYNFNHPAVRQSMLAVIGEAVRKFQTLPNFRGVNIVTSFAAPMESPNYFIDDRSKREQPLEPLRFDYSDATIARFEQDTGAKLSVPADAPDRFHRRYQLLTSEAWCQKWIEWRAQNMLEFYLEIRDQMRRIKPGLKIITGPDASAGYFLDYATTSGKSVEQSMREFGWDFARFHRQEGLYTIPWLQGSGLYMFAERTTRPQSYEMYLKWTRANTEPGFLKIGDGAIERMAMVHYGWMELERLQQQTLPERPRWQVPFQYTMEGMPQGDNALEPYVQAVAAIDPDSMLYGFTDTNLKIGGEQQLREFARFLRSLPKEKFAPVPGPNAELTLRGLRKDGRFLFYAVNPAPWPVKAVLLIDRAGQVVNLLTGEKGGAPVELVIPAYHGVSFAADGQAQVKGWKVEGSGEMFPKYVAHMRKRIETTAEALADARRAAALSDQQRESLGRVLREARSALDGQRPAEAWGLLNRWDATWCGYLLQKQIEKLGLKKPVASHGIL